MWPASTVVWSQVRIECDPALIDVDFVPHVIAEPLVFFDIDEADHDAGRYAAGPAHRRHEHGVFGAVAAQVAGDLARRGEADLEILVRDVLENPVVDALGFCPGIDHAPRGSLRQAAHPAVLAGDEHVGLQVLRIDLGGTGLAVQRPRLLTSRIADVWLASG